MNWNLADAKNRLSEVLDRAGREGPQRIRRRQESFVVLPERDYEELTGERASFIEFLLNGPRTDGLVPMLREHAPMRDPRL